MRGMGIEKYSARGRNYWMVDVTGRGLAIINRGPEKARRTGENIPALLSEIERLEKERDGFALAVVGSELRVAQFGDEDSNCVCSFCGAKMRAPGTTVEHRHDCIVPRAMAKP